MSHVGLGWIVPVWTKGAMERGVDGPEKELIPGYKEIGSRLRDIFVVYVDDSVWGARLYTQEGVAAGSSLASLFYRRAANSILPRHLFVGPEA